VEGGGGNGWSGGDRRAIPNVEVGPAAVVMGCGYYGGIRPKAIRLLKSSGVEGWGRRRRKVGGWGGRGGVI